MYVDGMGAKKSADVSTFIIQIGDVIMLDFLSPHIYITYTQILTKFEDD